MRSLGVSDITINRSQCWHKDLLRGSYRSFLDTEVVWGEESEIFRIVLYLQDSSKLKIIPGSHLEPISLENDDHAIPPNAKQIESVPVKAGSVVVMDVRTTHRGAEESDFLMADKTSKHRILIATTLGLVDGEFTEQLEVGNAVRLRDWMKRNGCPANL